MKDARDKQPTFIIVELRKRTEQCGTIHTKLGQSLHSHAASYPREYAISSF